MIQNANENSSLGIRGGTNQSFQAAGGFRNSGAFTGTEDDISTNNQPKAPF